MTQEEALKILKRGHNVYLTGAAGSGKTYVLNKFIQYLKAKKIHTGITASTGIAATYMDGMTIHAWAGIGVHRTLPDRDIVEITKQKRIAQRLQKAQTLIIDEVSMLDAARLDLLEKVARVARGNFEPFGGMQVVLCGDLFQLPPVARANELPPELIYKSPAWGKLNLRVCYLHEQHRQGDMEYLEILNAIRDAAVDQKVVDRLRQCRDPIKWLNPSSRYIRLYTHNENVDWVNQRELARLPGEEHKFIMNTSGIPAFGDSLKKSCLAPEMLVLKKDAMVIFVKNNFEKGYVNGTLGKVSGFTENGAPIVTLMNNKQIAAEPETWSVADNGKTLAQTSQIPLRLAWAITVHKSQGMTLDAVQVDLSKCFEKGMGYVALSRVRSLNGLQLLGFNRMALQVNEETLAFNQELKKLSEVALQELINTMPKNTLKQESTLKAYSLEKIREKHPAAYAKWTTDEEECLATGYKSGKSVKMLSEMLGRKEGGIRSRLIRLGLIE